MEFFRKAGINFVTFHTNASLFYPYIQKVKEKFIRNLIKSLKELEKFSEDLGIKILLENAGEHYEINKLSDIKIVLGELESLKINLDIGHALIYNEKKEIFEFIKSFKERLFHLHFHDNNLRRISIYPRRRENTMGRCTQNP